MMMIGDCGEMGEQGGIYSFNWNSKGYNRVSRMKQQSYTSRKYRKIKV